jgi:hypothetical protein
VFTKHRCELSHVKSGGIVIFVRENFFSNISVIENSSKCSLWIKIRVLHNEHSDVFDELEDEYIRHSHDCTYTCLLGDFNARTSNVFEYLECIDDTEYSDIINNNSYVLDNRYVSKYRTSKDNVRNNFGNRLIDLCKHCGLFSLNGRVWADKDIGKTTSKDRSVVDYCIGNSEFLSIVKQFEVDDFCSLYSDCHNPIHVSIALSCNTQLQSCEKKNIFRRN